MTEKQEKDTIIEQNTEFDVRDYRDKDWLWLDKKYVDEYAKHLGMSCTAVYLSLCRHANSETGQSYPSI